MMLLTYSQKIFVKCCRTVALMDGRCLFRFKREYVKDEINRELNIRNASAIERNSVFSYIFFPFISDRVDTDNHN